MTSIQDCIAVDGKSFERLVIKNDIYGIIKADPNIALSGLVPVIDGKERYELAFTTYLIGMYEVEDYTDQRNVRKIRVGDDLRELAHQCNEANKYKENYSLGKLYDFLVEEFKNGGVFHTFTYTARSKKGSFWRNTLLCANKRKIDL